MGIKNLFFSLVDMKNDSIAINFYSLKRIVFVASLQVLRSFDRKTDFNNFLFITFLVYSFYYKMWFPPLKNNTSQKLFMLVQTTDSFENVEAIVTA